MDTRQRTIGTTTLRFTNPGDGRLVLSLEPWAREYLLDPYSSVEVVFEADSPGIADVSHEPDRIVVYAWPGATARVICNGVELNDRSQEWEDRESTIIVPPTTVRRSRQQLAWYVVETIEAAGIRVPPASRLWQMKKLLNSDSATIERNDPDFEIALEAERDLQLLGFVFDQCPPALRSPAFLERLNKAVEDPALPQTNRHKSHGRDATFELFVGAICVAAKLLPVAWEEPDVTCVWNSVKYGFAAKRIKNLANVEGRVRKAVEQIERSGFPGVIVLDACPAFNPENLRLAQMPDTIFRSEYFKNCKATWSRYQPKVQDLMARGQVLGLILHDQHVRMQNGQWSLAGMTMTVNAESRSAHDRALFDKLSYLYTHALPDQRDVESDPILLP